MTPDEILKGACFPDAETRAAVVARVEAAYQAGYEAAREWRPIETAPKDGTRIYLWLADEGFPVLGAWMSHEPDDDPDWYLFEMGTYRWLHDITHWQPLPAPPKEPT